MDVHDKTASIKREMKRYRERWKAVEEIERQELRAMPVEEHWKQINALARFAIENGLTRGDDDGEMDVFLHWEKLKNWMELHRDISGSFK